MASPRWTFTDNSLATPVSYKFDINPKDGGSPTYQKNIEIQNTLAPGGKVLLYEGQDPVQTVEFTGTILEQAQYEAMILWFSKRHQIQMVDDLGRVYQIYITEFTPRRERAVHHYWKHSYSVKAIIISWVDA